ncbi:hypothetical protein Hdeb2414_s0012g00394831 [Helianthus debilis subsp. tardiflorus]
MFPPTSCCLLVHNTHTKKLESRASIKPHTLNMLTPFPFLSLRSLSPAAHIPHLSTPTPLSLFSLDISSRPATNLVAAHQERDNS